jgi:hypothetical protein
MGRWAGAGLLPFALVAGLVSGGTLFYVSTVLTALNICQIKSLLKFDKGVI